MFQLPIFNIVVGIRHATAPGVWGPPDFSVAQLRGLNKFRTGGPAGNPFSFNAALMLCVPAGTDIRDTPFLSTTDLVEIDGFTGPCAVTVVWDVAFGFENEYRAAALMRRDPTVAGDPQVLLPGQGAAPSL